MIKELPRRCDNLKALSLRIDNFLSKMRDHKLERERKRSKTVVTRYRVPEALLQEINLRVKGCLKQGAQGGTC